MRKETEEATISSLHSQKVSLEVKREELSNTEVHLSETKKELERRQAKTKNSKLE